MKNNSRTSAILLAVVFVLPVVLAWFALQNDWFTKGSTNRGELLQPTLNAQSLLSEQTPLWRILYVVPADCDAECTNALYSIEQIWLALGKESDRAQATVFVTEESDPSASSIDERYTHVKVLTVDQQNVKQVFKDGASDGIFLVDTLNNVVLRYPVHQEQQQAVMHSRDILADLKKLLKLSRIG
ncbi:hypothetical protein [Alteromonas oceanisediminis]|uniref:hypothetical protein n=1 Tax=Alteromonas oceanisediminis TaxID=2836180 RepID=UPI001BD9E462|nr:hypothetical protein [Alteromonas oceanisediminis]MBT0587887.1 hypothetical protein [Alteromonas oceanisediminis]